MAKYKYISESKLDNFLQKVFKKAFDQNKSASMKKIRKQDPELAKDMAKVDDIIDNYKKKLSKLPKKEQERRVQKAWDSIK